jgi:hypothetical protein
MVLQDVIGALNIARAAMKIVSGIGGQLEGGIEVLLLICRHAEVGCRAAAGCAALTIQLVPGGANSAGIEYYTAQPTFSVDTETGFVLVLAH